MKDNLLTRQQLLAILEISSRTLARMKQAGMPFVPVKAGYKQVVHHYELDKVKAWMDEQTVEGTEHKVNVDVLKEIIE